MNLTALRTRLLQLNAHLDESIEFAFNPLYAGLPDDWERRGESSISVSGGKPKIVVKRYPKPVKISAAQAHVSKQGPDGSMTTYDDRSPSRRRRLGMVAGAGAAGTMALLLRNRLRARG